MTLLDLLWLQNTVLLGAIVIAACWESLTPALPFIHVGERALHIGRNFGFFVLSTIISSVLFGGLVVLVLSWAQRNGIGLLQLLPMPWWLLLPIGFLLTDMGDYFFHRLMHTHRILWLAHCVHHSDPHMDASTALRTHPAQSVAAMLWKLLLAFALGIPLWVIALHDLISIGITILHHSNLRFSLRIERVLRYLIITPALHRAHHSPTPQRSDTNYGGLLVIWDRWFGTYCEPDDSGLPERVGLDALRAQNTQSIWGMLLTPWRVRHIAQL